MSKPVILTGLRANNDLHIGNYFGALLPLIDMAKNHADEYEINLFVPDLHSFTTPIDHSQLHDQIMHNLKLFVAAGLPLDHPNIHIYRQSYVPAHSELTWILDNFSSMGDLGRMTQFKDKSRDTKDAVLNEGSSLINALIYAQNTENNKTHLVEEDPFKTLQRYIEREIENSRTASANDLKVIYTKLSRDYIKNLEKILELYQRLDEATLGSYGNVGLFNYPVLMAADILLYGATYVPVGDDQSQHLEFARDIAERMNNKFGELFTVPKPVKEQHAFFGKEQGLRIKDLVDPTKKMSKSDETGKGVIFLGDSPEAAAKKIKSATTDSLGKIDFMNEEQAGIRNLLQILALTKGQGYAETAQPFQGSEMYGSLKTAVAEAVGTFLGDFQERLANVNEAELMSKLEADDAQMNQIANDRLLRVQRAVGLRA